MTNPPGQAPQGQIMTLRGAGVEVTSRQVRRVLSGLCLITLAVLVIVFTVVGADKNGQINRLRHQGVAIEITVSACRGLLGGSGSNEAGFACQGTFALGSHRYRGSIPGDTLYPPGSRIRGVSVPGDPSLFTTPRLLAAEHASWRVFILPAVLLAILVLLGAVLVLRGRTAPG
jgi:hypothetical protein